MANITICESPKKKPEAFPFLIASLYGYYIFWSYFLAIIPSYPKDDTVRILIMAYMMRFDESL